MSEDQIKKLLEEASASSTSASEKLMAAVKLKGSMITDDELTSVTGGAGASTVCAACLLTTPIASPGSLAGSIISAENNC